MRLSTFSILLQVLVLGYASAQVTERGPHNQQCGVNSQLHRYVTSRTNGSVDVKDASLANCKTLLNEDDIWKQA